MDKKELYDIAKDAVNDAELRSSDIPPIDLYVDQILNLMSERLMQGSERFRDRQMTKTMINNYSKDGLITPVKGKKYNKEQILQMLTVYTLKGSLTINEIKRLLKGAYDTEGFNAEKLTQLYDRHLDIKDDDRGHVLETLEAIIERNSLDVENDLDFISIICALSAYSAHLRSIAQAMIDSRFPEPADDDEADNSADEENGEKDKDKKERKEEKKAVKKQRKEEKKEEKKSKE